MDSLLGIALRRLGRLDEARKAERRAIHLSMLDPTLFEALMALTLQQLDKSELTAQRFLREHPENAAAMRLIAEVAARTGKFDEAERFLKGALSLLLNTIGLLRFRPDCAACVDTCKQESRPVPKHDRMVG